jgi:hypothetical protein
MDITHNLINYANKLKKQINRSIEQSINVNQTVDNTQQTQIGGFRSMHCTQLYRMSSIDSAFNIAGDASSGSKVGP